MVSQLMMSPARRSDRRAAPATWFHKADSFCASRSSHTLKRCNTTIASNFHFVLPILEALHVAVTAHCTQCQRLPIVSLPSTSMTNNLPRFSYREKTILSPYVILLSSNHNTATSVMLFCYELFFIKFLIN